MKNFIYDSLLTALDWSLVLQECLYFCFLASAGD